MPPLMGGKSPPLEVEGTIRHPATDLSLRHDDGSFIPASYRRTEVDCVSTSACIGSGHHQRCSSRPGIKQKELMDSSLISQEEARSPWSIRQVAVYHSFDLRQESSICPLTKAQKIISQSLAPVEERKVSSSDPTSDTLADALEPHWISGIVGQHWRSRLGSHEDEPQLLRENIVLQSVTAQSGPLLKPSPIPPHAKLPTSKEPLEENGVDFHSFQLTTPGGFGGILSTESNGKRAIPVEPLLPSKAIYLLREHYSILIQQLFRKSIRTAEKLTSCKRSALLVLCCLTIKGVAAMPPYDGAGDAVINIPLDDLGFPPQARAEAEAGWLKNLCNVLWRLFGAFLLPTLFHLIFYIRKGGSYLRKFSAFLIRTRSTVFGLLTLFICIAWVLLVSSMQHVFTILLKPIIVVGISWFLACAAWACTLYAQYKKIHHGDRFLLTSAIFGVMYVHALALAQGYTLQDSVALVPPCISFAVWTASLYVNCQPQPPAVEVSGSF